MDVALDWYYNLNDSSHHSTLSFYYLTEKPAVTVSLDMNRHRGIPRKLSGTRRIVPGGATKASIAEATREFLRALSNYIY